ncbi:uncharacterized protein PHACADRAFT_203030 [Phanerochaete carnosa HHB-10118-sp]|uniref:Uncharacterized protein n=1 Tax=Phanerochaete carnosa (strain HHB-10118-sp) TaxID=650164 RepID=K5VB12_PHACS|nr:uncharacterized protein PHACADRAFT_203030 [Phanerochaete carnosa HHB-10118-sp]EKM48263.1 hypothetical protein PHACADRAFT_203030 [Phanerochaete carnosa HHB-10118-sp]
MCLPNHHRVGTNDHTLLSACLFVEADVKVSGKVVGKLPPPISSFVLDAPLHQSLNKAYKFVASSRLKDSLLMIICQYRHLGMRVLVSTQEPTVVPAKLLALCSFIVAHRFQSPG